MADGAVEPAYAPPGSYRELIRLALPLILSGSFWTIQITVDRVFLSSLTPDAVSAAMTGALLYFTPFILLQMTANYASTFVSQYIGAKRPERVGPVVWQAIYFAIAGGLGFLLFLPFTDDIIAQLGHSPKVQELERIYVDCLCWMALPALVVAAVNAFFAGKGDSWTVLKIDAIGTFVNVVLDWFLIFGNGGFPEMGIAGAGWATVAGSCASALLGLCLFFRKEFRTAFHTSNWRLDRPLFLRLLRFGLPSGFQFTLDTTAFTAFVILLGWFGDDALAASTIAFSINTLAFMPMMGLGQAVSVLVGRRLGEDNPDSAQTTAYKGFRLALMYMTLMALLYAGVPELFVEMFAGEGDPLRVASVRAIVPNLLLFVAFYSLFDAMYIIFSSALRGAGDTDFVSAMSLLLPWPIMVLPTYLAYRAAYNIYWAWGAASLYVLLIATILIFRFRHGRWRSMRVIESPAPILA